MIRKADPNSPFWRAAEEASKLVETWPKWKLGQLEDRVVSEEQNGQHDFVIRFKSESARQHFKHWLCGSGEQQYWEWMRYREQEEDGDITALDFKYHQKLSKDPDENGRHFDENFPIGVTEGRLDRDGED